MATTAWWFCGKCGYQNKPRIAFGQSPAGGGSGQPIEVDPSKCEQCGASRSDPNAVDYKPVG